jgi:protoporphyrinogen oxidase
VNQEKRAGKSNIYIIGGGVTGLSCAFKLASASGYRITVFEKDAEFGGMVKNFGSDGWHFELGPHNIHTQDEKLIQILRELLFDDLKERIISTLLFFQGQKISYPLKGLDVLTTLEPLDMLLTGWDFFQTRLKAFLKGIEETEHFDEWICRRFGRRLFDIYFDPYVRKVWKIDSHDLSSYVGVSRIPVMSIRQLILNQFGMVFKRNRHPEEAAFDLSYLPLHGAGRITDRLKEEAEKRGAVFHNCAELKKIVIRDNRIVELHVRQNDDTSRKTVTYPVSPGDLVISTIPVNMLLERGDGIPEKIKTFSGRIDYTSLLLFYLKVKEENVFNKSWVYFSNEKTIFNRITEHTHDQCEMVPPGYVSLCVEIPCSAGDLLWRMSESELYQMVLKEINSYQPLAGESITGFFRKEVKYAYPRFRVGFLNIINSLFEYFQSLDNFYTLGRQGLFCYANIDQCMQMAFTLSENIIHNPSNIKNANELIFESSFPNKIKCDC